MSAPRVTVVMGVYNGERYLREAIDSILGQTLKEFEFIIINDGSTDSSKEIIESYDDARIRLIGQENHGLIYTLNLGINEARAPYIARMDADDISAPDRLSLQVDYLDRHPGVVAVGSSFWAIDKEGTHSWLEVLLTEDEDLRRTMYLHNPFGHGTVMMRKDAILKAGGYDPKFKHVEDFDLWRRIMKHGQLAALPNILYSWRVNLEGISHSNTEHQSKLSKEIVDDLWKSAPPKAQSTQHMRERAELYRNQNPELDKLMNQMYLRVQFILSWDMIGHGLIVEGIKNFISFWLVGKSSWRVAYSHVLFVARHRLNRLLGRSQTT